MLIDLAAAKAFLNLTSTRDDAELGLYLEAVGPVIETYVGAVERRTVTETVTGSVLSVSPVLSIDSVTVGGKAWTGTPDLRGEAGLLHGVPSGAVVTYTAGRATVPAAIRLAALVTLGRLWETQRGSQPLPVSGDDAGSYVPQAGPDLPYKAQLLLAPYRRGTRVA